MRTSPKLIIDVGKQLNFLPNLWGCRSHSEEKHSQLWTLPSLALLKLAVGLINSFASPAKAREEILKKVWRTHCWLFLVVALSGMMNDFPTAKILTGLLTLPEWKSHSGTSLQFKLGGAISFLLLCSVLRFAFLVIQCFCDKPVKACIWTFPVHENKTSIVCAQICFLCHEMSILCLSFPAEAILNIMLHWA